MEDNNHQVPEQSAAKNGGQQIAHGYHSARALYQVFGQATEDLSTLFAHQLTKIKVGFAPTRQASASTDEEQFPAFWFGETKLVC